MQPALKPLIEIALFNTAMFKAAYGDVSEAEADQQPAANLNNLKWTLGHIVTGRSMMIELAGGKPDTPFDGIFMASTADLTVPTLVEIATRFDDITQEMMRRMALLDKKALATAPASPFPTAEKSTLAALAFLLQHESYHLGQTSYLRRLLGKEGLVDRLVR